ncbi:hypothetical protein CBR_g4013 [Chara braunii]|uniref:FAD-binding FR-type domain-containing protein n=1 Tax=Chara braunii TaxID=69332 RepID=A0A388KH11_CHABU|nr:hypothetical protein CBR_g4013 [Chara braunii]|eukprot:GBG69316.1 hypothetical protein CBR_g4013 [Chara braunii]
MGNPVAATSALKPPTREHARAAPTSRCDTCYSCTHQQVRYLLQLHPPADGVYGPVPAVRVAIVGGGLAGLSAAVEVVKRGGSVVLIEKTARLGGNSAKASSGMNAANSTPQLLMGIEDDLDDFKSDTIKSGKGKSLKELVDVLVEHSADAVNFLQGHGIDLSNIVQLGGHSHPRTHRSRSDGKAMNIGWRIMSTLIKYMEAQPSESVQILKNAQATSLIVNDAQHVVGVNVTVTQKGESGDNIREEMQLFVDAVVLATGGYSADREGLLKEYVPEIRNLATTNGPFATGDGVKIAKEIGAGLMHMDQVQLHPTGFVDPKDPANPTKFLAPESLRGCGGILLNQKGERFVNELTTRDAATKAIMSECDRLPLEIVKRAGGKINGVEVVEGNVENNDNLPISAYMLMTEEGIDKFDRTIAKFYIGKGFIQRFENATEFCKAFALPEDVVVDVLENYGKQREDPYGKTVFPVLFSPHAPLYALIVTPSLHYTMGGLKFSQSGQILRDNGEPIVGLFGAGEVTGMHVFVFTLSGLVPTEYTALPLIQRYSPSKSCAVLRFALPSKDHVLGLLCGQYLAVRAQPRTPSEQPIVQFYSPLTPADEFGFFEVVIKHHQAAPGSMPDRMMSLPIGGTLEFAGPLGGFTYEPNMYEKVGMIAGGTGIAPMMQIIRTVIRHPADNTHLSLLYGNAVEDEILCKEELMYIAETRENVRVHMFLEQPPQRWTMGRGYITEEAIKERMPAPGTNSRIVMCGPATMIKVMKETLHRLGYADHQLYIFNETAIEDATAQS